MFITLGVILEERNVHSIEEFYVEGGKKLRAYLTTHSHNFVLKDFEPQ